MAAEALAAANRIINAIQVDGVRNGHFVSNSAMPASSHVRNRAKWVLRGVEGENATTASLVDVICWHTRVDQDAASRNGLAPEEKLDVEVGVLLSLGRAVSWRYNGLTEASLAPGEVVILPHDDPPKAVHADHSDTVAAALNKWMGIATRLSGLAWYNAISYELHNHHHKPALTKRLATTTMNVSGLKDWCAEKAAEEAEGIIFHDMFHPHVPDLKAQLARNKEWAKALSPIKFDNLRKRIPVKAPDCGLAMNYPVLVAKARSYQDSGQFIPSEFDVPRSVTELMLEYVNATTTDQVERIVSELRAMSAHLEEASAYLAGFMLGRDRRASDDEDLDLKMASKTNTILGSPAYARAAGAHPGTFNAGVTVGYQKVSAWKWGDGSAQLKARIRANAQAAEEARQAVINARLPAAPGDADAV